MHYLDDLAAKLPAPGGGSAAALNAALGAALISMVVNFTLGKPKYAAYERDLEAMLGKSEKLRHEFLNLVDLDVQAFNSKNARDALNIPLMTARLCFEAVTLCPELLQKGNTNLISDVACAAILLEAAFSSAACNVEINLKNLNDKKLAHQIRKELLANTRIMRRIRLHTEVKVGKIIRG
jgi:formiminotetrahydrofolate cyclodeaminase